MSSKRRRSWISILVLLGLLFNLFQGLIPGTRAPTVLAHNLQTKMVYMFFDPDTQAILDARMMDPLWVPGTPLLQVGDELGLIIKVVPRDGTDTGVGGHIDFYVPDGVRVIDVAYLQPTDNDPTDGITGYDKVPMKGQSPIAIGAGPIGAKSTSELIGLPAVGPNINGVTENPVVPTSGLHRGTIAGVYGDTGIFYSTDPDTAWGSWTSFTGATDDYCGLVGTLPPGYTGKTITNNSGDVFIPCNKWDAEQMYAWGVKGTTYTGSGASTAPIVDYGDGRGNAPWGFASGVAGPQSGYAWYFNWDEWRVSAKTAADMREAMSGDEIGPWKRIQYPGSRVSYDQPGLISSELGFASVDASNLGFDISSQPLPLTTSQTDTTSPKAIRWAVGQLTDMVPEFAWVKFEVTDTAAIVNEDGCPVFRGDTFGGDAGGTDNGKDHLWRYYEPSVVEWNGCLALGKPATKDVVKVGDYFQYKVKLYNAGNQTFSNVVVRDILPSGVQFISAVPAQNAGPNPLVWTNIGAVVGDLDGVFEPGEYFEATVTVKASGSGLLDNVVQVDTDTLDVSAVDTTTSGNVPMLSQSKSVSPTSVAPGETVQYTIIIDNIGGGPTGSPVEIRDYLEPGITYQSLDSVTVNGASYKATTTVNSSDPQEPVFTVPASIPAGGRLILKFTALVSATAAPGTYCNSYTTTQNGIPATTGSQACLTVGGGKIGDTIYRDWNGNGTQDPVDEGVAGVTVDLYSCTDATYTSCTLAQSTTTDANGKYLFEGLAEGYYRVVVTDTGGELTGYTNTGDPDGGTASQSQLFLADGQQKLNQDFGYMPAGAGVIGDTVWNDSGAGGGVIGNGIQDGTEPGIANVTVRLYEDTNGNGVIDTDDALVATTTTDASGNYSFTGLAEGLDYIVKVDETDADLTGSFTVMGSSTDNPHPVTNLTGTYNLADFGYYEVPPATISGTAFQDENFNGTYDAGTDVLMPNVTVNLYDDLNGNGVLDAGEPVLATTTTDSNGDYTFTNLGPGDYIVDIVEDDPDVPTGYAPTLDPLAFTLAEGQTVDDADFPFVQLLKKSVDKATATVGETLTYTILPNYPGQELLENLRVTDVMPEGTTYVAGSANAGGTYDAATDTVTWHLGSNTAALDGITPGAALCPAGPATIIADADTHLFSSAPTLNSGGSTKLRADSDPKEHMLLHFNISSLPADAVIDSAFVQVTVESGQNANRTVSVRQLTYGPWNEGTGGENGTACVNGATWNAPNCTDTATGWNGTGGNFGTAAPYGASLGTISPAADETTYSVDVTSVVDAWHQGTATNYGFALLGVGTDTGTVKFHSRTGTAGKEPTLVVNYSVPTPGGCTPTGMGYWSPNGAPSQYSTWDGTAFGTIGTSAVGGAKFQMVAGASSPESDVKILVKVDDNNDIFGEMWNGGSWSAFSFNPLETAVTSDQLMGAAVAFEQQSGDAVLVWNDVTQLSYRVWDSGTSTWGPAAAITPPVAGEPRHMHLAADPTSDDMVLVVGSAGGDYAVVWDGTTNAWGNSVTLDTSTDNTDVYVAYEQTSGDALVVYGKAADTNAYSRIWNGSTWEGQLSAAAPAGYTGRAEWLTLGADPASDQIALGVHTTNNETWLNMWTGSAWSTSTPATSNAATGNTDLVVAVAFEGSSGEALAVYAVEGSAVVRYRTWSSGSGWSGEANGPTLAAEPSSLLLAVAPPQTASPDQIMLSVQDTAKDVYYVLWTGSGWNTLTPTALENDTGGGTELGVPMIFLWDDHLEAAGAGTTVSISASPSLVSGSGAKVYVEMTVTAEEADSGVDPDPLQILIENGATGLTGSCTPADQAPQAITAGGSATFNWECTITNPGTLPNSVSFRSTPTGDLTYAQATSNSVLVSPPLTYQVTVDSPQTLTEIVNTAQMMDGTEPGPCDVVVTEYATECYAVADSDNGTNDLDALSFINPTTGSTTDVGLIYYSTAPTVRADHIEAATWSLDGNTLYVVDRDDTKAAGADLFGTLDPATALFTPIGSVTPVGQPLEGVLGSFAVADVDGLAFDWDSGILYAVHRRETGALVDLLFQIDPATGRHVEDAFGAGLDYVPIQTASFGLYDIDDISFDPVCGALYGTLNVTSGGAYLDRLVIIDPTDGTVTDVGRLTDASSGLGLQDVEGLSFGTDGILYAVTADGDGLAGGSGNPESLWIVDKETAEATLIGSLVPSGTSYADYESVACKGGSYVPEEPVYNVIPPTNSNEVTTSLPTYSLSGYVWYDDNVNQTIDAFPPDGGYIEGAFVIVYEDTNGNGVLDVGEPQVGSDVTDVNGYYEVTGLPPGDYVIDVYEASISAEENFLASTADNLGVTITTADITDQNFGYFEGAYIGDTVFWDKNRNGIYEPYGSDGIPGTADDETGLNGVTVTLTGTTEGGDPVSETYVTGSGTLPVGEYLFLVPPGDYTITYDHADVLAIDPTLGDQTTADSYTVTVAAGDEFLDADFGVDNTGTVGDFIWNDVDGDGIYDAGEPGISNVTVWICTTSPCSAANAVGTTATDADGYYLFEGLPDGTYYVSVDTDTLPDPGYNQGVAGFYSLTGDPDEAGLCTTCDNEGTATVTGGGSDLSLDFGYQAPPLLSVSGAVWDDVDGDGVFDLGETGLAGVTVSIEIDTDGDGLVDQTVDVVTDANGDWSYDSIPAGSDVTITVDETTLPNDSYVQTGDPDQPGVTCTVCDASYSIDNLAVSTSNIDFGYDEQPGSIAGTVCDGDGDGLCEAGEDGLAGVTIVLTYAGDDGILGTADDVVTTDVTDANGDYSFADLGPGLYQIEELNPYSYESLADADGGNPDIISVNLGPSENLINQDFEDRSVATIGDYVWLDEDGDGIQDAGEAGIANVIVTLTDSLGNVYTTTTDLNGGYVFDDLRAGTYTVTVDTSSMPAGLAANPTGDPDEVGACSICDHSTTVTVVSGEEYVDADFGYNWVSSTDSTDPALGATGAIGDRVWIDADGDGVQDTGEAGLGGVTVNLYSDPDGNGVYDTLVATTTTAPDGSYIFDGVAAGAYVVEVVEPTGYHQTGDPDGALDNKTTSPIVLAPGDVYVNADFGYQPDDASVPSNSIGDTVWLDANGDGLVDPNEPGIPGVLVELTWYGADGAPGGGDDVLYYTTTDENGEYLFEGLPDGNYQVEIVPENFQAGGALYDSENPTYDANGTGTPNVSTITGLGVGIDGPVADLNQDFGYSPSDGAGHEGVIGDTIFYDANGNGQPDAGEGIPGVQVDLYTDPDGNPDTNDGVYVGTAYTDANGNYYFGDLDPTLNYRLIVDPVDGTPTLPAGLTNTVDPDGGTASRSLVFLSSDADGIKLDQDFGYTGPDPTQNTIGDTVWLDADRDGSQAGPDGILGTADDEPGIPGVLVELTWYGPDGIQGTADDVLYYATTDENGEFFFDGLPDGTFDVTILSSNFDPGGALYDSENPTYDFDGGLDSTSTVSLDPTSVDPNPVSDLDQDFGYSPSDGAGHEGIIGDTIFLDLNGDGQPDAGEGIAGVRVDLYTDPDGDPDTDDGVFIGTAYTDADGNFLFGDLNQMWDYRLVVDPTGTTLPAGLTNTIDPDGGTPERSLVPLSTDADGIDLGQDFGYAPAASGTIGDTVWLDLDRDNMVDADEPGIAGVTVSLIEDTNGNGMWDPGEPIIATDVTDENGHYGFGGLSLDDGDGDADYLVWVNDTDNVLGESAPTYDSDGGTLGISAVALSSGTPSDMDQDFAYAPSGLDAGEGLIGDTIYLDADGSGSYTPGDTGLEGVVVELYDSAGRLVAVTTTDENGHYYFDSLNPDGTYTVTVDTTTLPNGGTGLSNSADPDMVYDSSTVVNLSEEGGTSLSENFGYKATAPHTISGTIWEDTDADGMLEGGEGGRFEGVTVVLYDSNGNIVATTTTDAYGDYSFPGLPDGTYYVDVTDENNVLNGYWHSQGDPSQAVDNTSKADAYQVTLSGADVSTVDFGYYVEPGAVGNLVWYDWNGNGVLDNGEPPLEYMEVTLTIAYPNGDVVTLVTYTDANGYYSFDNLLLDESFNGDTGDGSTEPTYTLSILYGSGYISTYDGSADAGGIGNGTDNNADNSGGELAYPSQGGSDNTNDFGFDSPATAVTLAYFRATRSGRDVRFEWQTSNEVGHVGFNLYVQTGDGWRAINQALIPAQAGDSMGPRDYAFDAAGLAGNTFQLEDLDVMGQALRHGPFQLGRPYGERIEVDPVAWSPIGEEWQRGREMRNRARSARIQALVDELVNPPGESEKPVDPQGPGSVVTEEAAIGAASTGVSEATMGPAYTVLIPRVMKQGVAAGTSDAVAEPEQSVSTLAAPTMSFGLFDVLVEGDGLYRLTYEAMRDAGIDLQGVQPAWLALTNRGESVPIHVQSQGKFGPGGYIEFYGQALDTLYTTANVYTLQVDASLAERVGIDRKSPKSNVEPVPYYMETLTVEQNETYRMISPSGDPWYEAEFTAWAGPISVDYEVTVDHYAGGGVPEALSVHVWGVQSWGHHVAVDLNGSTVADEVFTGITDFPIHVDNLDAGSLHEGLNTITLRLPLEAGEKWHTVAVESYGVTYPRAFVAREGRLTFEAAGEVFRVEGLPSEDVVVYRITAEGVERVEKVEVGGADGAYHATFVGSEGMATYAVSTVEALLSATVEAARLEEDITSGLAQYLVISHPHFTDDLQPLVQAREAQGLAVKVVDVEQVYLQFSDSILDAQAIRDYVRYAAANMGTESVLLVGGDTYDYHDYLGLGTISFVPSLYAQAYAPQRYVPVDPLYADVDGDNVPDLAIGRFPARTLGELGLLLGKTLTYAQKDYGQTAVMAADVYDAAKGLDFRADSEAFRAKLVGDWAVRTAYVDDNGVLASRQALQEEINEGVALTSYVGHSGETVWGNSGLFNVTHANALSNAGKPTVVVQSGCWTMWYTAAHGDPLGIRFLLAGDKGAAAALGSVALAEAASQRVLGELLMPRLTQSGMSVGAAVQAAKAELAVTRPWSLDVLLGWTLLGDPALVVQP